MDNAIYIFTVFALSLSVYKSKQKTMQALKKAWKSLENILPQLLAIVMVIGVALSYLTPEQISQFMGAESGFWGVFIASIIGSITLIPGFIAFPLSAALLNNGAGVMQIAAFISTLMMVGIITIPLEIQYFGKKAALLRNGLAYTFSIIVALIMGGVL